MENRKLHVRISERGKPDFGFDVVTDLSTLDIVDLFSAEKKRSIPPPPPPGPPCRTYREIPFVGRIETKESKAQRARYEAFMAGYMDAIGKI